MSKYSFFSQFGRYDIDVSAIGLFGGIDKDSVTVEELYQAFKERLIDDIRAMNEIIEANHEDWEGMP